MIKMIPYYLSLVAFGLTCVLQTWPLFALVCLMTAFVAYREVMSQVEVRNASKAQLDALNDRIKLLEERSDALHSKYVQSAISGKRL